MMGKTSHHQGHPTHVEENQANARPVIHA